MDKKAIKKIKAEIIDKLATLITAAFGFVAALAWNDTIRILFKMFFNVSEDVIPMVIYATFVTIVAVLITVWIGRVSGKLKK